MAEIVPIDRVLTWPDNSSGCLIKRMKATLQKQGQIEPLQVRRVGEGEDKKFQVFYSDAWGNEIVQAARELGWGTLLIVEMERYER